MDPRPVLAIGEPGWPGGPGRGRGRAAARRPASGRRPEPVIQNAAADIGVIIAPNAATDFIVLGLAIFLGGVVGVLVSFSVEGVRISLSTSVGTLLAGLLVGHLRTRYPLFGRIPMGPSPS